MRSGRNRNRARSNGAAHDYRAASDNEYFTCTECRQDAKCLAAYRYGPDRSEIGSRGEHRYSDTRGEAGRARHDEGTKFCL